MLATSIGLNIPSSGQYIYFFNKIYLEYVNTLTAVLDNTKIVPGQPISCRTLAVRGGHGTTSSGYGRYSSEKMAQKKKHCSRDNICNFKKPDAYATTASYLFTIYYYFKYYMRQLV
jgi:hypothetical protein